MSQIELDIGELLGYGGPERNQASKIGSAKIGSKTCSASPIDKELLAKEVAETGIRN